VIAVLIFLLACVPTKVESYAERNGWVEIKSPRPDLQCWRREGGPHVVCANSLNSTHGASNGNN
jgi:hypothetical protein